jgi:predicted Zn-dependent protease with MMP-like domain
MARAMERQDPFGALSLGEAPDAKAIETLARAALSRIPATFAQHLSDVVLLVEEFADEETLAALGIEHPLDLTGLYHGRPLGDKSAFDSAALPDRIHLYRRAILNEWVETGVRLDDLVAHVVIHEVGHHFGLSDDDMHALEDAAS